LEEAAKAGALIDSEAVDDSMVAGDSSFTDATREVSDIAVKS
jgi:hypothetical protein